MARAPQHLFEGAFLSRLRRSPEIGGQFYVESHGLEIPFLIRKRPSPVVVVTFAGAFRRHPQFGSRHLHQYVPASMIAIADPSLGVLSDLTTAWYAGHDGFETQKILPDLIRNVARACDAERIIFVGRSAGGFAALYYSWMIPGSVCLAINPQTKLDVYSVIDLYRHRAWPNLDKSKSLSEVIVSDLVSCYAERFENTVIYLQSAPDYSHVRHHFAPFLAGIEVKNQTRLIARLGYWGREGHGVIPAQAWLAWLSAAVTAPTAEASDIQKERQEYDLAAEQEPSPQEFDRADKLVARARIELGPELSAVNERSTGQ